MSELPIVIGLGEVLWDVFPDHKKLGGAPSNFACHTQQLGADAYLASCVGNDELGREIREHLQHFNLDRFPLASTEDYPTGTVEVTLDHNGVPDYLIRENVAWDHIPWSEMLQDLVVQAKAMCFGSLAQRNEDSGATIRRCLDNASQDCVRIFDVNLRQSYYSTQLVTESLERADVLKLNEDELPEVQRMLGISVRGDFVADLRALQEAADLDLITLTRGPEGTVTLRGDQVSWGTPGDPEIVDTVGAGDAFTAALTMGLLQNLSVETINIWALQVAEYVCTRPGATPVLPESLRNAPNR